jgi:CHAD domain-containing protein
MSEAQRGELQRPAAEFARTVLDAALKRVSKRGRHFASLAPRELHRLRIAAKKLRYAAEFFAPLYDADQTRDYRAALARLQDTLGVYNDAVTVTRLAERASRGLKGAAANEARGIMLGWSAGMQDAGTRHLKRIWNDFRAAKPFWK